MKTTIIRIFDKDLQRFNVLRAQLEVNGMKRVSQPEALSEMLTMVERQLVSLAKKK